MFLFQKHNSQNILFRHKYTHPHTYTHSRATLGHPIVIFTVIRALLLRAHNQAINLNISLIPLSLSLYLYFSFSICLSLYTVTICFICFLYQRCQLFLIESTFNYYLYIFQFITVFCLFSVPHLTEKSRTESSTFNHNFSFMLSCTRMKHTHTHTHIYTQHTPTFLEALAHLYTYLPTQQTPTPTYMPLEQCY